MNRVEAISGHVERLGIAQENEMDVSQLVAPSSSATVHGLYWHCFTYSRPYMTKYGDAVIYAVYFTMAWSIAQTNMEVL